MSKNKNNKKKNKAERTPKEPRDDRLQFEGLVQEALPGAMFSVEITSETSIVATLSGKMRQNRIRVLPGDKVKVEVSPYDLTRGRIVWRGR